MYLGIGRWCFRHRRFTALAWIVFVIGALAASSIVGSDFGGEPESPDSETKDGFLILEEHFGGIGAGQSGTIVFQADQGVEDPEVQAAMESLFALVDAHPAATVISPYTSGGGGQIAQDGPLAGELAFARVELSDSIGFGEGGDIGALITDNEPAIAGLRVEVGGEVLAGFEPPESELIGLGFAIVILIVSFGSVLAMGLPIGMAVAGVSAGVALSGLASNFIVMPEFATTIGAMIGLGVGIDYALFIVTRFRENLHLGDEPEEATARAMDTAGRAVVFAGVTVVASLLGLLLIGLEFVAGLGVAASITVAVTMLASITLLPALLGFAQLKVEMTRWRGLVAAALVAVALVGIGLQIPQFALGIPLAAVVVVLGTFIPFLKREVPRREPKPIRETGWHRWSRQIQRRPWRFAIGGTLILLTLSAPVLGIRLGFSDEGNYPEETTTRQAYDLLAEGFGPGFNGPFFAVTELDSPEALDDFRALSDAIRQDPGVAFVSPAFPNDFNDPQAAVIQIVPSSAPQDEATEETVKRIRREVIPAAEAGTTLDTAVTGFGPASIDFSNYLGERSLVFFGVVLLLSFTLLLIVFRSILVPIKAVIMNMLSISGAYGAVVAIFQWGWGSGITGIEPAPIEPFIPMMMFAIVFGLSMDYEVFLLSRIKEEYVKTDDAFNSVADGLASTARVISAAAAIMVVVFGSFLLEDSRITKVFGTGLGLAVFLDATLVRMLLVPATMELLGRRNWWIPKWLDRILPELNVEGTPRPDLAETTVAASEPGPVQQGAVTADALASAVAETPPAGKPSTNGASTNTPAPVTAQDLSEAISAVAGVVSGETSSDGDWSLTDDDWGPDGSPTREPAVPRVAGRDLAPERVATAPSTTTDDPATPDRSATPAPAAPSDPGAGAAGSDQWVVRFKGTTD